MWMVFWRSFYKCTMASNYSFQRTALRAAAEAER